MDGLDFDVQGTKYGQTPARRSSRDVPAAAPPQAPRPSHNNTAVGGSGVKAKKKSTTTTTSGAAVPGSSRSNISARRKSSARDSSLPHTTNTTNNNNRLMKESSQSRLSHPNAAVPTSGRRGPGAGGLGSTPSVPSSSRYSIDRPPASSRSRANINNTNNANNNTSDIAGSGADDNYSNIFTNRSPSLQKPPPSSSRPRSQSGSGGGLFGGNMNNNNNNSLEQDIEALQSEYFNDNLSPSKSGVQAGGERHNTNTTSAARTGKRRVSKGSVLITDASIVANVNKDNDISVRRKSVSTEDNPNKDTSNVKDKEGAAPLGKKKSVSGVVGRDRRGSSIVANTSVAYLTRGSTAANTASPSTSATTGAGGGTSRKGSMVNASGTTPKKSGKKSSSPAIEINPDFYNYYYNHDCSNYNFINPDPPLDEEADDEDGEGYDGIDSETGEPLRSARRDAPFSGYRYSAQNAILSDEENITDPRVNYFVVSNKPLHKTWTKGPLNAKNPEIFDASDRNLFCMDVLNINNFHNNYSSEHKIKKNKNKNNKTERPGPLCVVGGADHGLKVFDMYTMKLVKQLYNKQYGHTEWVTSVRYLSDGRIVSGGMDNKICLWDSFLNITYNNVTSLQREVMYNTGGPARCVELTGHLSTISQVEVNANNNLLLSASYDRTLRLYHVPIFNISAKRKESAILSGAHKSAVTRFNWCNNIVFSGDKKGIIKVWDLQCVKSIDSLGTKRGAVTALRALFLPPPYLRGANANTVNTDTGSSSELNNLDNLLGANIVSYGDESGALSVVDLRSDNSNHHRKIFSDIVHPGGSLTEIHYLFNNYYYDHVDKAAANNDDDDDNPSGNSSFMNDGAANNNQVNSGNYSYIPPVVTCGADKLLKVLEPRMNFKPFYTIKDHEDFIYSLNVINHYNRTDGSFQNVLLSGDGQGWLHFHDPLDGKLLYKLKASTAAVRATSSLPGVLACAGDDGKASVFYY